LTIIIVFKLLIAKAKYFSSFIYWVLFVGSFCLRKINF